MTNSKDVKEIVLGAGAGAFTGMAADVVIDDVLGRNFPVWREGPIPSIMWTNGLIVCGYSGLLTLLGHFTKSKQMMAFGLGGLLAELGQTVGEQIRTYLGPYGLRAARLKNNTYAGPVSPQPSPFAPPVNPQAQLIVGSKSGGPTTVYKPNVSTPPCAGAHAQDQTLFV